MSGYYSIVNRIKDYLKNTGFVTTVTIGDIYKVDLAKQTLFPLCHIMTNSATLGDRVTTLNLSILFMDIVDESKTEAINVFDGNDNELDVLNTQLEIANRFVADLLRGSLNDMNIETAGEPLAEPFVDRFENKLAGWTLTFDALVPNNMTIC
jgi:hypothetical protein